MSGAGGSGLQRTSPTGIGQFPGSMGRFPGGSYGGQGWNNPQSSNPFAGGAGYGGNSGWGSWVSPGQSQPDFAQPIGGTWGGNNGPNPFGGQQMGGNGIQAGHIPPWGQQNQLNQMVGGIRQGLAGLGMPGAYGPFSNIQNSPQSGSRLYDFRDLFGQQQAQINQAGLRGMAALQQNQINPMLSAF